MATITKGNSSAAMTVESEPSAMLTNGGRNRAGRCRQQLCRTAVDVDDGIAMVVDDVAAATAAAVVSAADVDNCNTTCS